MDDFSVLSQRIARVLFPAVLSLALIIIFITMARVIMDSRRETAVFRALGAKRIDIVAIYVVYSLMIATLIIIFSTILGFGSAFALSQLYAPAITEYARVAYGVFDTALQFTFFSIPWYTLLLIVASIVLVSLIALLQPLIRNVRRSPLSDMRQE
ncbi:FtsX-like permease family protein [compost metagenome]